MKINVPFNLPNEFQGKDPDLDRLLNNMVTVLRALYTALIGKISLTDNIQGYYKEMTIQPPYGVVTLPWKYTSPPNAVTVCNITWHSNAVALTNPIQPVWSFDSENSFILINNWLGLNKGGKDKYQITLKVE